MRVNPFVSTPRVFLFDLGGVLVVNTGLDRMAALLPAPASHDEVMSRWLASPVVRAFETGRIEPAEFARQLVAEWNLESSPEQLLAEFATWPKGFYPGAAELLSELHGQFRLACLSNSNAIHWPRLSKLLTDIDVPLASHELGQVKPDAACFIAALDRIGASPQEIAFFDDAAANVAAATALGMRAFQVNGPAGIQAALSAEGWIGVAEGQP
jgi:HAD superfamily hydrolase (TIGR01509 family)